MLEVILIELQSGDQIGFGCVEALVEYLQEEQPKTDIEDVLNGRDYEYGVEFKIH